MGFLFAKILSQILILCYNIEKGVITCEITIGH